jgi:DNA (cytosine-5)-methyltransferase 1
MTEAVLATPSGQPALALRAEPQAGLVGSRFDQAQGRRPRLLDLFCCAGGAAMGYHQAGFDVVGVDIKPQPRYPFPFIQSDAVTALRNSVEARDRRGRYRLAGSPHDPIGFDAVHASPPCQKHSDLAKRNGNADAWPCFIEPIRALLIASGLPYVIENVEGAPMVDPVMLCGTMFPETRVIRHRLFETNWPLVAPAHGKHPLVYTMDKRKPHYGWLNEWTSPVQVTGGGNCSRAAAADAMGMPWANKAELNEAIPPAYTRFIGEQLLRHLSALELERAA